MEEGFLSRHIHKLYISGERLTSSARHFLRDFAFRGIEPQMAPEQNAIILRQTERFLEKKRVCTSFSRMSVRGGRTFGLIFRHPFRPLYLWRHCPQLRPRDGNTFAGSGRRPRAPGQGGYQGDPGISESNHTSFFLVS